MSDSSRPMIPYWGYRQKNEVHESNGVRDVIKMNHSSEKPMDCLVVGAGALGMVLSHALVGSSWGPLGRARVTAFSRQPLVKNVRVFLKDGQESNTLINHFSGSPAALLSINRPRVVLLCVPPEKTEAAFNDWLNAFELGPASAASVLFIFCNNGCLSQAVMQRTRSASKQYQFARALFYVGATKEKTDSSYVARWTGGCRVHWSSIGHDLRNSRVSVADSDEYKIQIPSEIGFLECNYVSDILKEEREKFFTNFVLASAIGPNLVKNKSLSMALDDEALSQLAHQFELLWRPYKIDAQKMRLNLQQTIEATSENVNSLSFAGAHGDCSTMNWFIEFIEQELTSSKKMNELNFLKEFITNVQIAWRVAR